jgi:XTP/dITP diphosphohydrolase
MRLLLATANRHKLDEIRAALLGTGIVLDSLVEHPEWPEPEETGETFEENALLKARALFEIEGGAVLADDSGLEVDALGGAPGVRSKRFSPEATHEANNRLLLARLHGVTERRARFRCVLALVTPRFAGTVAGACEGRISETQRGFAGFGYDPLFVPDDLGGRTMAEATMVEKNAISHRGRAVRQLPELLSRAGLLPPSTRAFRTPPNS